MAFDLLDGTTHVPLQMPAHRLLAGADVAAGGVWVEFAVEPTKVDTGGRIAGVMDIGSSLN